MSNMLKYFKDAASMKKPSEIPVAIWGLAPWYCKKLGLNVQDYFQKINVKLETQIKLQNQFPDYLLLPGIWPDFGSVLEASAFGCPIHWSNNETPFAKPIISNMNQVVRVKPVKIKEDGLFPEVIRTYDYFYKNIGKKYIEKYGNPEGTVLIMGPMEIASMIRGYSDFFLELYDNTRLVHKMLNIVTTTLLEWLEYLEMKIGKIRNLILCDHFPGLISPIQFEEFFFPYVKSIFDEYPNSIKLYHNEGQVTQVINRIPDLGASIFHFGIDCKIAKNAIGHKICLMGNLDPIRVIKNATPEKIRIEVFKILEICSQKGGFILSTNGGIGVDTKDENILAMMSAVKSYENLK